jgi:hypothetical protein
MTTDPVTPELALVDPVLRRRLLAGVPIDVPQHRRRAGRSPIRRLQTLVPSTPEPIGSRGLYTRRPTVPLVIAACSSLITLAIVGAVVELKPHGHAPATAAAEKLQSAPPSSTPHRHPVATTPSPPPVKTRTPKAKPSPPKVMHFSWPAVTGAVSYDVSFYARKGNHLVLELHPKQPAAAVTVSRGSRGGKASLPPGAYRWDVWPVTRAGRASVAVIQSALDIS